LDSGGKSPKRKLIPTPGRVEREKRSARLLAIAKEW